MKILNEKPPFLDKIIAAGMNPSLDRTVFTYGDTIYNPSGKNVPDYLIEHEEVHCDQQGNDPKAWWDKYLKDPVFRLNQELEAYAAQYAYMCAVVRDRNKRARILHEIANVLSGPTYGGSIDYQFASEAVKRLSRVKP